MAREPDSYPLLMQLLRYSWLPWYWVTAMIAIVMLLLLVLAAYLDGAFTGLSNWSLWRNFLDGPVLIIYILAVYPFVWGLWWRSVTTLQSLLPTDEGDSHQVKAEVPTPNRSWEWVSVVIGAVFWLSLWQPWNRNWGARWLSAYDVVTQMVLFGLLSLLIYSSFTGSLYSNRLSRQRLKLDIFEAGTLTPIAHSSLGVSIAFIGGISLSLLFQTQEDLLEWNNITVYIVLVCFGLLLFFLSMWSVHSAMAKTKRSELNIVQEHLKMTSHELKERMAGGSLKETEELSSTVSALVNYERRVKEVPEWPYNAGIIRRLLASILAPVVVFLIKILAGLGFRF